MTVSAPLSIAVERCAARVVVHVSGELDISGDAELRTTLLALCDEARPVSLVLDGLRFCDVPGVRVLVDFARTAAEHGVEVEIRGVSGQVDRLLDLTQSRGVLPLAG